MPATPAWGAFAAVTATLLVVLATLARRSDPEQPTGGAPEPVLFAVLALPHAVLGGLLVAAAWLAGLPATAFGLPGDPVGGLAAALPVGVGLGVAFYALDELATAAAARLGAAPDAGVREYVAAETPHGAAVVLLVVLPLGAGVEELLFRGALVGALSAGFGVSPWALAVASSVAFGVAHGVQGVGGVAVTGLLGFALAAAFVLTGSLVVVVVAHYLVNLLEYAVHEWLDVTWGEAGLAGQ